MKLNMFKRKIGDVRRTRRQLEAERDLNQIIDSKQAVIDAQRTEIKALKMAVKQSNDTIGELQEDGLIPELVEDIGIQDAIKKGIKDTDAIPKQFKGIIMSYLDKHPEVFSLIEGAANKFIQQKAMQLATGTPGATIDEAVKNASIDQLKE